MAYTRNSGLRDKLKDITNGIKEMLSESDGGRDQVETLEQELERKYGQKFVESLLLLLDQDRVYDFETMIENNGAEGDRENILRFYVLDKLTEFRAKLGVVEEELETFSAGSGDLRDQDLGDVFQDIEDRIESAESSLSDAERVELKFNVTRYGEGEFSDYNEEVERLKDQIPEVEEEISSVLGEASNRIGDALEVASAVIGDVNEDSAVEDVDEKLEQLGEKVNDDKLKRLLVSLHNQELEGARSQLETQEEFEEVVEIYVELALRKGQRNLIQVSQELRPVYRVLQEADEGDIIYVRLQKAGDSLSSVNQEISNAETFIQAAGHAAEEIGVQEEYRALSEELEGIERIGSYVQKAEEKFEKIKLGSSSS